MGDVHGGNLGFIAVGVSTVGASLLAKNVSDNADILIDRGALAFFASKLAPTIKALKR